jgi:hypothetical protein
MAPIVEGDRPASKLKVQRSGVEVKTAANSTFEWGSPGVGSGVVAGDTSVEPRVLVPSG